MQQQSLLQEQQTQHHHSKQASPALSRSSAAARAGGSSGSDYQPYTFKEYRERNYDAKKAPGYWQLGRLGPGEWHGLEL